MTNVGYIGGGTQSSGGVTPDPITIDWIKCEICCAYDTNRILEWTFVNGVRKISRISFSSAFINSQLHINGTVQRDFTYQAAYPFDLISIIDTLILV